MGDFDLKVYDGLALELRKTIRQRNVGSHAASIEYTSWSIGSFSRFETVDEIGGHVSRRNHRLKLTLRTVPAQVPSAHRYGALSENLLWILT